MSSQEDQLVDQITELYEKISKLESLKPSEDVNMLFAQLVHICRPPSSIDVTKLSVDVQEMRSKLIRLWGEGEGLFENHHSALLGAYERPLNHLDAFPYFPSYLKLASLEYSILSQHTSDIPKRIAFLGSGPLPLTSIILACYHLPTTQFDNYDFDPSANEMAARLVSSDPDLAGRIHFHNRDVMSLSSDEFALYDVVFLASLVGIDKEEKIQVIQHLAKSMAPGSTLMTRSARGARAFLYPIVNPEDLIGFDVLSYFHPGEEFFNSVVIARKPLDPTTPLSNGVATN